MGGLLELQSLDAGTDGVLRRGSSASFMCNGDNSTVSLWCG